MIPRCPYLHSKKLTHPSPTPPTSVNPLLTSPLPSGVDLGEEVEDHFMLARASHASSRRGSEDMSRGTGSKGGLNAAAIVSVGFKVAAE
jgi:hypothetical protein